MTTKPNPNEAPRGYIAEKASVTTCYGCVFLGSDKMTCKRIEAQCFAHQRKDTCSVIFKRKQKSIKDKK